MSKESAIARVTTFAGQSGGGVWPHIDRAALAAGLIARINEPNLVNQSQNSLCGPAALTRALATDDPDGYAQAAIDLFTTGRAHIGSLNVQPGNQLKQAEISGGANPADWIMLASIRDADNWFYSPAGWFPNVAGMTLPHTMESWLRASGYTEIINITYLALKPIPSVLAVEALRASNYFLHGYKVMLFIDADMLDSGSQDDLISMYPDHWIALDSRIADGGIVDYEHPLSFTAWSWARRVAVPVDASHPLTKWNFLHKYYGFIAARR